MRIHCYLPTRTVDRPSLPTSLWRTSGLLVETSEFASRLILLIQISSHGNCCIDWTTKARRKTLQHSIIHTDRHNAILLLPPLPPSPFSCLLIPISLLEESVRSEEGSRQTNMCVCVILLWSYLWVRFRECLGSPQLLSLFPSLTFYLDSHCLFISTFTDVTYNVQGTLC